MTVGDAAPMPEDGRGHDGDRALISRLQAQRGPMFFAFARRLGLSTEAAEDAVQESLLRLWTALQSGATIGEPDAWVFTTLYRYCMDAHRWRRRTRGVVERLRPLVRRSAEEVPDDRLSVWGAVDRLPPRQRAAVYLRYRADLAYEEIGAILGISPISARSHVSRGIDRLASLVSREDYR